MDGEFKGCLNRDMNNKACVCPKTDCGNHGICCRCVANHLAQKNLPFCFRDRK